MSSVMNGEGFLQRCRAYLTADHRRLSPHAYLMFVVTGMALAAAALLGIVWWVVGWGAVFDQLRHAAWIWLFVAAGATVVSHVGYLLAYREVARHDDGPEIHPVRAAALVVTGFGLVVPRGGFAIDSAALCEHGISTREASRRVLSLGILEYAVLAPAAFGAALVLLFQHIDAQDGLLPSWVIGVPAGTAITLLLLPIRGRMRRRGWVRKRLAHSLDAIVATLRMLRTTPNGPLAALGMALYWAADIAALGACLALFGGRHASIAALIVGYSTGYALTRRSLPLSGAGAVEALLPFALSWVSVPLTEAVLAVMAYRAFNLWLAVGPAAAGLRYLRRAPSPAGA
jgi:uncharacterized membrane protein YbhN (UPF0104 family)